MSSGRPWPSIVAAAIVAGALSFALGRRSAIDTPRPPPTHALASQLAGIDPVMLAPHSTRLVLAADVARLRSAPALAPYFAQWSADPSCQARIATRMRRIVAFARDATLSDLVFVFDGPVSRDELSQCVRDGDRARARARAVEYRGVSLAQHAVERDPSLLPTADVTELAQLTPSLLIAGPSGAVRATIDRALATPSGTSEALIAPLKTLSDRLSSGYSFALVSLVGPRGAGRLESLLSNVEGFAVGVTVNDRLRAEAILACADFDAPRSVADVLTLQQAALAREPALAPVRALIERGTIERRAADVRASIDLSADDVSLTILALRELARRMAQSSEAPNDASANASASDAAASDAP
ncbi:MAG: hypothetical protein U0269_30970 [Polyangiales bacterium]